MKTIKEVKDEVAKGKYDSSFNQAKTFMHKIDFDYFMDAVAKRYAEEVLREAALVCKEHRDSGCFDGEGAEANILNIIKDLK